MTDYIRDRPLDFGIIRESMDIGLVQESGANVGRHKELQIQA